MIMRIKKLHELRVVNELTQQEMAKILNCTQQSLSAYEKGTRDIPIDVLVRFADYFNVSIDYILEREGKLSKERSKFLVYSK